MKALFKQPSERLVVPVDFDGNASVIQSFGATITPRGLVAQVTQLSVTEILTGNALTFQIFGGTDGECYLITVKAEVTGGERRETEFQVWVIDATWQMPDGGAAMVTISEFVQRYGIDETVRMTDTRGDGRIDRDRIVTALVDAQALAEAHIGQRYALPLPTVPVLIKSFICDIARSRLYAGEAPEGIAGAAKSAIRSLERIQSGQMAIPGQTAATAPSETPVLSAGGGRLYPDGLKDFGL